MRLFISFLLLLILGFSCKDKNIDETMISDIPNESPLIILAYVDNASPTNIERIKYTIKFIYMDGVNFIPPEPGSDIAGFRIVNDGKTGPRKVGNKNELLLYYVLEPDLDGTYILPPIEVEYEFAEKRETVKTNPIYIDVAVHEVADEKLIEDDSLTKIHDDRLWFFTLMGFLFIVLVLCVVYFFRYYNKRKLLIPPLLPHEKAFRSISELLAKKHIEQGEFRKFYFRLSEISRKYTDERFLVNTLESTQEEIKKIFKTNKTLPEDYKNKLLVFFKRSDFAKWAKMPYGKEEMKEDIQMIKSYIEDTLIDSKDKEVKGV